MGNSIIPIAGRSVRIVKQLGEGGYAYVYLVEDTTTGEQFALKRMLAQTEETKKLAAKEVQLMKQLGNKEHIVSFHGACRRTVEPHNSLEFFVLMELCPGGHLWEIMERTGRSFRETEVAEIFLQVCKGVRVLHTQNPPIAHRDLKVENILLGSGRRWKLCDFGSCTTRSKAYTTKAEITREEEQIQKYTTAMYRAPEQADLYSAMKINEKVDIWALGCILYTIAYRQHPFQEGTSLQIMSGKYTIPHHTYSKQLEELISYLLTVDPDERPDIHQTISYIEQWQGHLRGNGSKPVMKGLKTKTKKDKKKHKHKKKHKKKEKESPEPVKGFDDWDPFGNEQKASSKKAPAPAAADDWDPFGESQTPSPSTDRPRRPSFSTPVSPKRESTRSAHRPTTPQLKQLGKPKHTSSRKAKKNQAQRRTANEFKVDDWDATPKKATRVEVERPRRPSGDAAADWAEFPVEFESNSPSPRGRFDWTDETSGSSSESSSDDSDDEAKQKQTAPKQQNVHHVHQPPPRSHPGAQATHYSHPQPTYAAPNMFHSFPAQPGYQQPMGYMQPQPGFMVPPVVGPQRTGSPHSAHSAPGNQPHPSPHVHQRQQQQPQNQPSKPPQQGLDDWFRTW